MGGHSVLQAVLVLWFVSVMQKTGTLYLLLHFLKNQLFFMRMGILLTHMAMSYVDVVPAEVRRGCQNPGDWSYRCCPPLSRC